MATQNSRAFLPGAPGMVWAEHPIIGAWGLSPLTMDARELAVGYSANATNVPGVSYDARHKATGSCFDANAVSLLMAVALAIRKRACITFVALCCPASPCSHVPWTGGGY